MTEEQKDAIVKAAKEMVDFWTGNDIMYMKCPQNLIDAVRAAEQPRWIARLLNEDEKKA